MSTLMPHPGNTSQECLVAEQPPQALPGTRSGETMAGGCGDRDSPASTRRPARSLQPALTASKPSTLRWLASRLLRMVAASLKRLNRKLSRAVSTLEWLRLRHLDFVPRPDDIFIVTYPRSGTTWMQMIVYQLTTDGDMDFPHISQHCPWFERSRRGDKGFADLPAPRLFKSHLSYRKIPKGPCKYIYVARNGKDVAVSYFHFYRSHLGFKRTFEEFFDRFLQGRVEFGSWFEHVKDWWEHRQDPNVLFLSYEELLGDLPSCLEKIIAFAGFAVAPEQFPRVLERCNFAFMKQHESQFEHLTGELWEQGKQLHSFLRMGRADTWKEHLSPQQQARFDQVFQKWLGPFDFRPPAEKHSNEGVDSH